MQSASNELTLTFQLYYGILLGVNLDIQTQCLVFYVGVWTVNSLQNGKILT